MERLIELVKTHPILFDKNHQDYMKTSLKDEIWSRLALELDYRDGIEIKEQWRKLRECHREALRRQCNKRRRNHGVYTAKLWLYQKQMEFLLPFMTQRGPDTTIFQETIEDDYVVHHFKVEDSSEDQPSTSESAMPTENLKTYSPKSRFKKKIKVEEQDPIAIPDPLYERQRSEEVDTRSPLMNEAYGNDSLYQFFLCMYNTVKNMPATTQLNVKKRIFDVVVEAEEELIDTSLELGVHHMV